MNVKMRLYFALTADVSYSSSSKSEISSGLLTISFVGYLRRFNLSIMVFSVLFILLYPPFVCGSMSVEYCNTVTPRNHILIKKTCSGNKPRGCRFVTHIQLENYAV